MIHPINTATDDTAFTVNANPMSDREQYVVEIRACAMRGRADGDWHNSEHHQRIEIGDDISNSVTSVQKDNMVVLSYSRDKKGKVVDRHIKTIANTLNTYTGTGNTTDQYIVIYD